MYAKICKLILLIFIIYGNKISNILNIGSHVFFIIRINWKIIQNFL